MNDVEILGEISFSKYREIIGNIEKFENENEE